MFGEGQDEEVAPRKRKAFVDCVSWLTVLVRSLSPEPCECPRMVRGPLGSWCLACRKDADAEYGVTRGIDFQNVRNVINFDLPPSPVSYVHRVGRTARGAQTGLALSFVSKFDTEAFAATEEFLRERDCQPITPYQFKMGAIEGLRYRVEEVLRGISGISIERARKREIVSELLASEALQKHFEDNPVDLQVLRHDIVLQHKSFIAPELKYIPTYLMPKGMTQTAEAEKKAAKKKGARKNNPLKSFKFQPRTEVKKLKVAEAVETSDDV
eukprot:m.648695 g.648695  ORF g.648695 m.648695 type:complete len:269 (+) comp58387_c0_seq33:1355-2161(+)